MNKTSNRAKYKTLLQTAAIAAALSACVQPSKESTSPVSSSADSKANLESAELEKPLKEQAISADEPMTDQEKERPRMDKQVISGEPVEYWVKRPGTAVYDGMQQLVRSLRLQPKVTVYEVVEGWGLISTEVDEWVNMSDIALSRPDGVLARPEESTGRPRIMLEDMLKPDDK